MARRRFAAMAEAAGTALELRLRLPAAAPPGYTPVIWVTEWLTLTCRSDWASRADGGWVTVRFASPEDRDRVARRASWAGSAGAPPVGAPAAELG